jgi:hypothetical protein
MLYLKVAYGDHQSGDFLLNVTGPLHSGVVAIPFDPNKDNDIVGQLEKALGEVGAREAGQIGQEDRYQPKFNYAHILAIDPAQTLYEKNQGYVAVRYVWWDEPMDGINVVITTRSIFILGDNGKTIDKVR